MTSHRFSPSKALLLVAVSAVLAAPSAQVLQAQCPDGAVENAALQLGGMEGKASIDSLTRTAGSEPGLRTRDDVDAALDSARNWAELLSDAEERFRDPVKYPTNRPQRIEFLCLQARLLEFYGRLGDDLLRADDYFARASLAFNHCLVDLPDGIVDWRRCDDRIGRALLDYRIVFGAARAIHDDPHTYRSYHQAKRLGITDINDPAPEFTRVEELIELSVRAARKNCRWGGPLGTALESTLCDAMELYSRERRDQLAGDFILLIRYDGGTLSRSSHIHQFLMNLYDVFGAEPTGWEGPGGLCTFQDAPLQDLNLEITSPQAVNTPDELRESLESLRTELYLGIKDDQTPPACRPGSFNESAVRVASAYARLLFRLARTAGSQNPETEELLADESCDILLTAVGLPRLAEHSVVLSQARDTLTAQLIERGDRLFAAFDLDGLIDFGRRYLERGEGVLTPLQGRVLHGLLAKAYYLRGDETEAVGHLLESNLTEGDLKEIRRRLREAGVGIIRR